MDSAILLLALQVLGIIIRSSCRVAGLAIAKSAVELGILQRLLIPSFFPSFYLWTFFIDVCLLLMIS